MQPGGFQPGVVSPPTRSRPSSKLIVAGVLAIVGVALAGVSLMGVWFSLSAQGGGLTLTATFGLFGHWDSVSGQTQSYAANPNTGSAMQATMILVVVSLILGAIGAILAFVASRKPSLRWGALLALVGGVVGIAAGLYLMVVLPVAVNEGFGTTIVTGFWGSVNVAGVSIAWGPGWAWYLVIVAGILMLVGGILGVATKAPAPAMAPPYPYSYPTQAAAPTAPGQPVYAPVQPAYAPVAPPPVPAQAWSPQPAAPPPAYAYPAAPPPMPAPAPPPVSPPMPPLVPAAPATGVPGQKFCANCGASLPEAAKFCRTCGTPA